MRMNIHIIYVFKTLQTCDSLWSLEFDGSFSNSYKRSFLKQNCSSPCAEFAESRGQIDKHCMAGSPLYFQFNSAKWKDLNWPIRPKNKLMWYLTIFTDSKKLNQSGQTKKWCGIFFLRNASGLRPRLSATPEKFKNAALFLRLGQSSKLIRQTTSSCDNTRLLPT